MRIVQNQSIAALLRLRGGDTHKAMATAMIRTLLRLALALTVVMSGEFPALATRSVGYERLKVLGVWTHVVTVNMNDSKVKVTVELPVGFPGSAEPFEAFIRRSLPAAAITGTFFSKVSRLPVGSIVVDGRQRYFGGLGSAIAITPDNKTSFRRLPYGRHMDWSEYETVLACGPTLLKNGRVDIRPREEGFTDPRVLGRAPRTAIGLTRNNKLKMIAVGKEITLTECAKILKALGCVEGINLDGGTSSALYYWGKFIVRPGRPLVNVITVHHNVPEEKRFAEALPEQKAKYRQRLQKKQARQQFLAGERLRRAGKLERAINHYKLAVDADPSNASYHVALAMALQEADMPRQAASELAAAGEALLAKGLLVEAQMRLSNAIALNPLHPSAHWTLERVYNARGLTERAEMERRIAESVEMALAAVGNVPSDIHDAYITWAPVDTGPVLTTCRPRIQGTIEGRRFTSKSWGFTIEIPPNWRFIRVADPTEINMQHKAKSMRAVLRIFPTDGRTAPAAYADIYFAGTFRQGIRSIHTTVSSWPAYQVHTRELVMGRAIESVTLFVLRGSDMFVLSEVVTADQALSAKPDFAFLRSHLEFIE